MAAVEIAAISPRVGRVLWLLRPVTSSYARIPFAKLGAFCVCIFKELEIARHVYLRIYVCVCVCVYVGEWLHLCAQYRCRYRATRREDWTGQQSSPKLSLLAAHFALDALSADWKRKSIEEAAYCFIRALQCDFRFFCSLTGSHEVRRVTVTSRYKSSRSDDLRNVKPSESNHV